MLSNRTANFNVKEEPETLKNADKEFVKQLTTPLPKFDINFKFTSEIEKEGSAFSFKNDLLDKKAYDFIKQKDQSLAAMELDDSLPNKNEETCLKEKQE